MPEVVLGQGRWNLRNRKAKQKEASLEFIYSGFLGNGRPSEIYHPIYTNKALSGNIANQQPLTALYTDSHISYDFQYEIILHRSLHCLDLEQSPFSQKHEWSLPMYTSLAQPLSWGFTMQLSCAVPSKGSSVCKTYFPFHSGGRPNTWSKRAREGGTGQTVMLT